VFYSASNAKLKVNDEEILASNASLSLSASLQPNYLITERNTNKQVASDGIGGKLSFNYYLTGKDYFRGFITGQGERATQTTVISGNFGGLNFDSGYLTSYSVNFAPNTSAMASAEVSFFDDLKGEFESVDSPPPAPIEILNFRNALLSSDGEVFTSGDVDNFIAGAYNYSAEVKPVYLMNETKPSDVSFGPKGVNVNFEIDSPSGYLPFSGSEAMLEVSLKKFNNVDMGLSSWEEATSTDQDNYVIFNTDGADITSAEKNATPVEYAVAYSSPFLINFEEAFTITYDLTISAGSRPLMVLVDTILDLQEVGIYHSRAWSNRITVADNTITLTADGGNEGYAVGTGQYGQIQIYNNPSDSADWKLENVKVTRTTTVPSELFTCSGMVNQRSLASAAGDYIKQTVNITQAYTVESVVGIGPLDTSAVGYPPLL